MTARKWRLGEPSDRLKRRAGSLQPLFHEPDTIGFRIEGSGDLQRADFSRVHHVFTGGRFSGRVARAPQQYALVIVEIHHHVRRFPQRPLIGRAKPVQPFQGLVRDDDRAVGIVACAENLQRSILISGEFISTC